MHAGGAMFLDLLDGPDRTAEQGIALTERGVDCEGGHLVNALFIK